MDSANPIFGENKQDYSKLDLSEPLRPEYQIMKDEFN